MITMIGTVIGGVIDGPDKCAARARPRPFGLSRPAAERKGY